MSPEPPKKPPESLADLFARSTLSSLASGSGTLTSTSDALASLANILASTSNPSPPPPPPFPTIQGRWFRDDTIHLDGYMFERCRFDNCRLFTATATFRLRDCYLSPDTAVLFNGLALKIARLLMHDLLRHGRIKRHEGELGIFPTMKDDGTITLE